jgi:hypothetical protein
MVRCLSNVTHVGDGVLVAGVGSAIYIVMMARRLLRILGSPLGQLQRIGYPMVAYHICICICIA